MNTSPRGRRNARRAVFAGVAAVAVFALAASPAMADPSASPSGGASGSASPGASGPSVPPGSKTFTIGIPGDIDSLNPYSGFLSVSYELYGDVYDLLEGWSQKDYSPVPGLASSWTHSADGLTWTFKIRSGVTWSDGQPLTADDVAYTFNRAINDEAANAQYYNYVKNVKSVDAPDATTAVFHLSAEDPIMTQLWVPVLPKHIWEAVSAKDSGTFPNDAMVGSGPFQLVKRDPGQSIVLKSNKKYWGGAPKIDYLVYRVYKDEDAMLQALRKGEIDAVDEVSASGYISLKGAPNIARIDATGTSFDELGFNTGAATVDNKPVGNGSPAARDPNFRRAVAYAIDLKSLGDKVLQGYGQTGGSIIPPAYTNWAYSPGDGAYTYDAAKAGQMLDAAGYTKGPDGNRIDPQTHKELNLRFGAPNDDPRYKSDVAYISGWLQEVGIKTTTQLVAEDKLTDLIGNGEVDMFVWGWGVEPDPSFQLSTMTCDQRDTGTPSAPTAGWSDSFYCSAAYDALFKQQGQTLDPTARATIVKQMQQQLYTDAPYIVLYYADNLEAYRSDKWTGLQLQPEKGGNAFFQMGTYTYRTVDVKTKAVSASDGGGVGVGAWIGIVAAVVIVLGAGGFFLVRRRATADERE
jgi:peptide/nickel transport system substrate-binding protein